MTRGAFSLTTAVLLLPGLAGCGPKPAPVPIAAPAPPPIVAEAEAERMVRASVVGGEAPVPVPPQSIRQISGRGDFEANFPAADPRVLAKAVSDLLKVRVEVAPGVTQPVTLITPGPVSRTTLLSLYEAALRSAGLALTEIDGNFLVQPVAAASAPGGPATIGYATEIIRLQFIAAAELKAILDPLLPGVVIAVDPGGQPGLTIAGTTGQRQSVRDLVRQFDVNWLRNMSFGLFVPQRTDARLIVPELDKLINAPDAPTKGLIRLIAMDKLNGIMAITGNRQYLEDVKRWIEVLDREGESAAARLFVYRVQNGRARDLARTLSAAFGAGGDAGQSPVDPFANQQNGEAVPPPQAGRAATPATPTTGGGAGGPAALSVRINADEVNNAVVIFASPRDYAVAEDALRKLDVPPAQVLIEAAITEVTLTDALRFGVQWNFQGGSANFSLTEGTGITAGERTPAPTQIIPGFSFFYGSNTINATLNALETRTNVKVISAPKLLVLNNQTAALQVGNQVPILTQSAVGVVNPGSPIVNSVSYRDTGVILRITPRVNAGGVVLIDISQEVSGISDTNPSGIDSPTFTTRRVASTIAAQDGQVLAIGGLFTDGKTFTKAGVPILSRIPVLGGLLFGRNNNNENRTELMILIKPTVLRTLDDGRAVTEELRAKLKQLEPFRTSGRIP